MNYWNYNFLLLNLYFIIVKINSLSLIGKMIFVQQDLFRGRQVKTTMSIAITSLWNAVILQTDLTGLIFSIQIECKMCNLSTYLILYNVSFMLLHNLI